MVEKNVEGFQLVEDKKKLPVSGEPIEVPKHLQPASDKVRAKVAKEILKG